MPDLVAHQLSAGPASDSSSWTALNSEHQPGAPRSAGRSPTPSPPHNLTSTKKTNDAFADPDDDDDDTLNGAWGWEDNDTRRYSQQGRDLDDEERDDLDDMPSDLRPAFHRPTNGLSEQPLLRGNKPEHAYSSSGGSAVGGRPGHIRRRSTFRESSPEVLDKHATRKRYGYAAFFLVLSLVSFAVQTETAVYIQHNLHWNKAYAMMYFTHGSWSLLWFLQLGVQRIQKWRQPWSSFWRSHSELLRTTAQMVQYRTTNLPERAASQSPWLALARTTAIVTCALTVAGASWYIAVDMTTASDLTAIYNCSAFFAYAFSVPILKEKLKWSKAISVLIAITGVIVVAYGGVASAKHGGHSGGGAGGPDSSDDDASNRAAGNVVIGIGSVIYGLYEVMYKRMACPPEDTSPGRSMIFANFFGSCIGFFTLTVLWIPLPILHYTGVEVFEWPRGDAAWLLAISTVSNAIFSGSFLVLISLTSPVLSSVAALLTIFIVALVDELLPPPMHHSLSKAAIIGGCLIIGAFLLLSYASFKEMDEERQKKLAEAVDIDSDDEERD